ncbi:YchJ family protein [Sphingobacterium spiritivorum]|uniref:YchJ family protein n=1 Tax=Sphingobacterium spiritivorum TaxID=258 RepID=UPI003DA3E63A
MVQKCPCGSGQDYLNCCQNIHENLQAATSAEKLMRARYAAFYLGLIDFIYDSFHPSTRRFQQKNDIRQWAHENKWMHLEIIHVTPQTVEFKAHYMDPQSAIQIHYEKSTFKKFNNTWYYVDGKIMQEK